MKHFKQIIMGLVFPDKQLIIYGALLIAAITGMIFARHSITGQDIDIGKSWLNAVAFGVVSSRRPIALWLQGWLLVGDWERFGKEAEDVIRSTETNYTEIE